MAHLRKKDRWLDHARAMIEGKSLAKTAALCGIHPTTAFRWRHRFLRAPASDKPRGLRGIVEADETFVLESFKGRRSDLPRKARRRGGTARHPGLHQDNIPILVASTASPPRTCPIISVGGALSKPGATNSNRQAGSKALSETGHTNR